MHSDDNDRTGALDGDVPNLEEVSERARMSLDEAVRALWDTYSAAESAARQTLSDAEIDLAERRAELDQEDRTLQKRSEHLEATFAEANRLLDAADHQHRVADDRVREGELANERASNALAAAIEQAGRLIAQAEEKALQIEQDALEANENKLSGSESIIAVAEEDARAIIAQARQRADKTVQDAELKATQTMEGALAFKRLQLSELESKENATRERMRDLLKSIESTLVPDIEQSTIDLRDELDADTDNASDSDPNPEVDDPARVVVDDAVRRAFDQWATGKTSG